MKTNSYDAVKYRNSQKENVADALTVEHPLSISVNGKVFTLTMQTPGNEAELARGLLFTEGIYKKRSGELSFSIKEKSDQHFISVIDVCIPENEIDNSQLNKRNLLSVASCGICGKTELPEYEPKEMIVSGSLDFSHVQSMFQTMEKDQTAFITSGGCHAAAVFSFDKKMLCMMEDIGRHNAVDKVVGAILNNGELSSAQYLLVSGRVSYEIVTKCFMAGIPFLLAVSAPSSLAVDFAKELGITLLGFCRDDRATAYAHPERMQ